MAWKFTEWYDKNKQALNDKRKSRYHSDPAYREQVKARTAQRRQMLKSAPRTGQSVADICEILEITPWTVSRWKTLGYIPVENLRGYQFTPNQMNLMGVLRDFMSQNKKQNDETKAKFEELLQVVQHNWSA